MFERESDGETTNVQSDFGVQAEIQQSGGFSVSVTGGDLSYWLRALQSQGRLQVLQRPQIMAVDNQEATINIGQRVPFIRDSRITENGTTLNTIQYENVGINLTVTPRINDDGFVRMDVNQQIESLTNSTLQITQGVNAVIIDSRTAETSVTVQDGHTIIIGGIISTRDDTQESKVPLFGDLPLVGNLFRSTKVTKERSELLIILTPRVVRNVEQADAVTNVQVERVKAARKLLENYDRNELIKLLEEAECTSDLGGAWERVMKEMDVTEEGRVITPEVDTTPEPPLDPLPEEEEWGELKDEVITTPAEKAPTTRPADGRD
jgi:type II secretory pathway component GspD/PulD (secretin)